jgi:hypothetical protein
MLRPVSLRTPASATFAPLSPADAPTSPHTYDSVTILMWRLAHYLVFDFSPGLDID